MDNPSILKGPEIRAISTALSSATAGPLDGAPRGFEEHAESAFSKIVAVPRGGALIAFSVKELELLWLALGNGASDDTINHLGLRSAEKRTLAAAANRIKDAGNLGGPRLG